MSGNPDKLETWGEITRHLGVDRKTVLARGYPLHYHRTGVVFALKSEIAQFEHGGGIPTDSQPFPTSPISQAV